MSLRQMEYLLAVARERSFTRAAQRLGVSQATLSHQVRALEREVGEPLLERLAATVLPTPMGREYLPYAASAVRAAAEARRVFQAAEPVGLRVATLHSIALGLVPPAVREWRESHPRAQVTVMEYSGAAELARELEAGAADVGVGPVPPGWHGGVYPLGPDPFVVVLPADDPLAAGRGPLPLADLADRAWVLYAEDNALAEQVMAACAAAGFRPRAAAYTHHTATALKLAAAGLGPAIVPRNMPVGDAGGVVREPEPAFASELAALTVGATPRHVAAFIRMLMGTLEAEPPR